MGELLEFIWSQKQTLPQLLTLLCRLLPYTTPITSDTMKKYFCLPRMMLLKFHTATNCKRKQISGYSWNMLLCVILTCLQHLSNYDVKGALQASAAEGLYSRKSETQVFPKKTTASSQKRGNSWFFDLNSNLLYFPLPKGYISIRILNQQYSGFSRLSTPQRERGI